MFTLSSGELIAVTARQLCPRPLPEQVERLAEAGFGTVILREKDLTEADYLALADEMRYACERHGLRLIIHSFPECARELGLKHLHMPLPALNAELCREFICGASVHSAAEAVTAEKLGAAYVTAGHVFVTDCKKGLEPRGLDFLSEVCRSVSIPVYAIGGITPENAESCIGAGASGVCVMSGVMRL